MRDCVYKALFVFFVFLLCLPPIILGAFDFYLLSMQWPPGYCYQSVRIANQCKRPFPQSFTIHGLWPQNNSGRSLPCPQAPQFIPNQVTSDPELAENMKTLWPDLKGRNEVFWKHEWTNHGTCTNFNQLDYFRTTCNLALDLGLDQLRDKLWEEGMVPGRSYPLNSYKAAIESAYNLTPLIACKKPSGTWTTSNTAQMFEIRFCVDRTTEQFINCNWFICSSCGNSPNPVVAFPMAGLSDYVDGPSDSVYGPYVDEPSDCGDGGSIAVGLGGYFQFWVAVKSLVLSLIFQYVCF